MTAWCEAASDYDVSECGHRAVLVITRSVEGTTTNVARERTELKCTLPAGHRGQHRDAQAAEVWDGAANKLTTVLRDETEAQ